MGTTRSLCHKRTVILFGLMTSLTVPFLIISKSVTIQAFDVSRDKMSDSKVTERIHAERSRIDGLIIDRLLDFAKQKRSFAIVTFMTDFAEQPLSSARVRHPELDPSITPFVGGPTDKVIVPATEVCDKIEHGPNFRTYFIIKGSFKSKILLSGHLPTLGRVCESRLVDPRRNGDEQYNNLHPLIPTIYPYTRKPSLFLAVAPANATSILDSHFIALQPGEDEELASVFPMLLREGSKGLSQREAEDLLSSLNPWKVWLGLCSLSARGNLTPTYFAQAFKTLPSYSDEALILFFSDLEGSNISRMHKLLEQVIIAKPRPVRITRILNIVQKIFLSGREVPAMGSQQDLFAFRKFIEGYRRQIESDPTMHDVASKLDILLEKTKPR